MSGLDQHARHLLAELIMEAPPPVVSGVLQQFLDARPRLDDFHGEATRTQLSEAWNRCNEIAAAFEASAGIAPIREAVETDAAAVWEEVAA